MPLRHGQHQVERGDGELHTFFTNILHLFLKLCDHTQL
jgi:hypothetical protein